MAMTTIATLRSVQIAAQSKEIKFFQSTAKKIPEGCISSQLLLTLTTTQVILI
jgi:hypothetical protein